MSVQCYKQNNNVFYLYFKQQYWAVLYLIATVTRGLKTREGMVRT